ncbi:MAG: hypothetical protein MUP90_13645 [Gammaproteobacteria bacterium]|nr:hypothetical protein [Gammaproteobacteria bacterium]
MSEIITVNQRFCGPPDSGNGGYVCGLLGGRYEGAAEVTLRSPPPLDRPMAVLGDLESGLRMMDGEQVVAEACTAKLDLSVPELPDWPSVQQAGQRYAGFQKHLFPDCFVCGPRREPGDGLRVFAGQVEGTDMLAAPWTPGPEFADENGRVKSEFIWASLDCPGYFAVAASAQPMLLGRLTLECERELTSGTDCTVLAWSLGQEGRKYYAGTALFDHEGHRIARARAVWVALRD